jgi:organic radical activating enzyme
VTLKVSEIFGPTLQGEGPSIGKPCYFVRLSECNLHCSWCDTPYTWAFTNRKATLHQSGIKYDRAQQQAELSVDGVMGRLHQLGASKVVDERIVVSGGEPMLQQAELSTLILNSSSRWLWEVETAGTIMPEAIYSRWARDFKLRFNVSPKLETSGNALKVRFNPIALRAFNSMFDTAFKFVVTCPDDLNEIESIVRQCEIDANKVYLMPEGTSAETLLQIMPMLVPEATKRGWAITPRLHVLLWGDERGK